MKAIGHPQYKFHAFLLMFLVSCAAEIGQGNLSNDNLLGNDNPLVTQPIDNPTNVTPSAGQRFAIGVVNQAIMLNLNESKSFNVSITGSASLSQPVSVNLSANASALDPQGSVQATLNPATVTLAANETKNVEIVVKSSFMSPSSQPVSAGGTGKLELIASEAGSTFQAKADQSMGVDAKLVIELLTRDPHTWMIGSEMRTGTSLNIKKNAQTQVIMVNKSGATIGGFHVNPTQFHTNGAVAPGGTHMFNVANTINSIGFYVHNDAQDDGNQEFRVNFTP